MRIGINLSDMKMGVITLDGANEQLSHHCLPMPRDNYRQTIETITTLVEMAEDATRQTRTVGTGILDSISPYIGVVENANPAWLNGQPFDRDLNSRLNREMRLANGVNCLAASEAVDDAAAGAQTVFAVVADTGCGAGATMNGRVHTGGNDTTGEWGHNPLLWMDEDELRSRQEIPRCCGKQGCIKTSTPETGFATDYQRLSGKQLEGNEIISPVTAQDALAGQVLSRYRRHLTKSLAHMVNTINPDVIVLGGGISSVGRLYRNVSTLIKQFVFGSKCEMPLRKALHGDSGGVHGTVWLWPQE